MTDTAVTHSDLVSYGEIAERLGVGRGTPRQWHFRRMLPTPLPIPGRDPVWEWKDIEEWAIETGRMKAAS